MHIFKDFFLRKEKKYTKALVLTTGGGNDAFSAATIVSYLRDIGIEADVSAMLSPMAAHIFDSRFECPVNRIGAISERYIPNLDRTQISFVDGFIPAFYEQAGISLGSAFALSLRYGTEALVKELEVIIEWEGYDLVVGVDIGGDILARGAEDAALLTPLRDFAALYLLSRISTDTFLVEFGYGTDAELTVPGMAAILEELRATGIMLAEGRLERDDIGLRNFREMYGIVRYMRAGNTMGRMIRTIDCDRDIVVQHRHHLQIGKSSWDTYFDATVPGRYARMMYILDPRRLATARTGTCFKFRDPFEQFVRIKSVSVSWATEFDLGYVWKRNERWNGAEGTQSLFLLTPSTRIPVATRQEIIEFGILGSGADAALLLWEDREYVSRRKSYTRVRIGDYMVVCDSKREKFAEKVAKRIEEYLHPTKRS